MLLFLFHFFLKNKLILIHHRELRKAYKFVKNKMHSKILCPRGKHYQHFCYIIFTLFLKCLNVYNFSVKLESYCKHGFALFFEVDLSILKIIDAKKSIQIIISKFLQSEHTHEATIQVKKEQYQPLPSHSIRSFP